ncbi:hypothetical protein STEG23_004185 [Scotinomys teguina]
MARFFHFVEYRFLKYDLMILWISSLSVVISPISFLILLIWMLSLCLLRKFHGVLRRSRKMGPVFVSILLTCVFLLVGKFFFNDFVEYVFCALELVFFSFFYPYYSKLYGYITKSLAVQGGKNENVAIDFVGKQEQSKTSDFTQDPMIFLLRGDFSSQLKEVEKMKLSSECTFQRTHSDL